MDGSLQFHQPAPDISAVAGRITAILAARAEQAALCQGQSGAARFDAGVDTIYFAALLLVVVNGTGRTRELPELLTVLDTVEDVVGELRLWLRGHAA